MKPELVTFEGKSITPGNTYKMKELVRTPSKKELRNGLLSYSNDYYLVVIPARNQTSVDLNLTSVLVLNILEKKEYLNYKHNRKTRNLIILVTLLYGCSLLYFENIFIILLIALTSFITVNYILYLSNKKKKIDYLGEYQYEKRDFIKERIFNKIKK